MILDCKLSSFASQTFADSLCVLIDYRAPVAGLGPLNVLGKAGSGGSVFGWLTGAAIGHHRASHNARPPKRV